MTSYYIHNREHHFITDVLSQELTISGNPTSFIKHLLDIPKVDNKKQILIINWPHLFYHEPLSNPTVIKSLRRLWGFKHRLHQLHRRGIKIVWLLHNLLPHEDTRKSMDIRVRRWMIRFFDGIAAFCPRALEELHSLIGPVSIPEGVVFYPPLRNSIWVFKDREGVRNKLNIEAKTKLFLAFGLWREYKGFNDLITAFKNNSAGNIRLIILGQPTASMSFDDLRTLVGDDPRITLLSKRYEEEELGEWLTAADWAVFPYRRITMSGAVVSAVNWGCPVIIPDLGCLTFNLQEKAYLTFQSGRLEETLNRAITIDQSTYEEMKLSAKTSFSPDDWKKTVAGLINFCNQL